MKNILLLASKSASRQKILQEADIPFKVIEQDADEEQCDRTLPFAQLLAAIAVHKMNHARVSPASEGEHCFVLTVDTMVLTHEGTVLGKPRDKETARAMIQASRRGGIVASAFCLDKKIFKNNAWILETRKQRCVRASFELDMPDAWIEHYLDVQDDYTTIAGGLSIEGYGMQFLTTVHGSYSTALGLPIYELREDLESLGFFE